MNYYNKNIDEVLNELNTSIEGLTENDSKSLLEKNGLNEIKEGKKKSKLKRFLSQFNDMMIIILIIVAIITFIYGLLYSHEYSDTIIISVVILINAVMGYIQEQKAEVSLENLKNYVTTTCKVKRNNNIKLIDTKNIVKGDIIHLEAGDKVPADARIISLNNLSVDESLLTGESIPVSKNTNILKGDLLLQDRTNMLFCGTSITVGNVCAVVTETGMNTELGKIATSLNTPYKALTPLQLKIKELSKTLTFIIFLILIFIFIYGLLNGYKIMEIIMLCVSLAVAAIPEGLPAVITITLSTGANTLAKKNTIVRQMNAIETLGCVDIICSDKTGTITQNKMTVKETYILNEEIYNYINILCNDAVIYKNKYIGDPTETCLYEYLKNKKIDIKNIKENHINISEAPFDSNRKMMSTINKINNKYYILTKGSTENILNKCNYIYKDNKKVKITKELKDEILNKEDEMATKALRVIGYAYKEIKDKNKKAIEEENNLIFVGLTGMIDPPRKSVINAVKECKKAGIRPIMITGDSIKTGAAIAKEVGIITDIKEAVLGSKLDTISDEELIDFVKKYSLYARVSPEHKERIVKALQKNNKVVAMTGDGVNDAPAIKDAHVGACMGITGTEVTKQVSDIILMDESFETIVTAVEEGRRIFSNIRNNVVYSLSSNFAEIFIVLIAMLTGSTILLPIHILFIDLVTDSIPSICLAFEQSEKGIMNNKPRGLNKPLFTPFTIMTTIFSAIIETTFVLFVFFISKKLYGNEIAMSLALLSLVMQEIVFSISCRNLKTPIIKQGLFKNKQMNIGLIILIIIELLVFLTPIGKIINITSININILLYTALFNLLAFILYELMKILCKRAYKD